MKKYSNVGNRIVDLNESDYISRARTAPQRGRRERDAIETWQRTGSLKAVVHRTGFHPQQACSVVGADRNTPEYNTALALYHNLRNVLSNVDDLE